jgi:hypothetical protein
VNRRLEGRVALVVGRDAGAGTAGLMDAFISLSDDAGFVTGATIPVDGGQTPR